MNILRNFKKIIFTSAVFGCATISLAETSLPKEIRLVVPYSVGGASDQLARVIADQLNQKIQNSRIYVENKPGASGQIGTKFVSTAKPDGSTLLIHTPAWATYEIFYKNSGISVPNDLQPVAKVAEERYVIAASPKAPFKNLQQLVDYSKINPGVVNYASGGLGESYLIFESFKKQNSLDMVSVEYKGASPALMALISDEVQLGYQPLAVALNYASTGKMNILAVSGKEKIQGNENIQTFVEANLPNGEENRWYSVYAPKGTPEEITQILAKQIEIVVAEPSFAAKIKNISMVPAYSGPEELGSLLKKSIKQYKDMANQVGIKPI